MFYIKTALFIIFLTMEGIRDLRERKISMKSVLFFGIVGIITSLPDIKLQWMSLMGGIAIGVGLLLIAKFTREKVGFGDGWIFTVSGVYLGFYNNLSLFFIALFLAAMTSVALLVFKRVSFKTELPFVSFVLPAYFITVLLR